MTQVTLDDVCWDGVEAGTEALVERWLVQEGATVSVGQPLATIVVVKTSYDLMSPAEGVLSQILVRAEDTFARGTSLAVIQA